MNDWRYIGAEGEPPFQNQWSSGSDPTTDRSRTGYRAVFDQTPLLDDLPPGARLSVELLDDPPGARLSVEGIAKVFGVPYWILRNGGSKPAWRRRPIWRLRALWWRWFT